MSSKACRGCALWALMASRAPPSAAAGVPPPPPAAARPPRCRPRATQPDPDQRMRIRPVPHESRLPVLERKPHRLLLPGQRRRREPARRCTASRMKVSARTPAGESTRTCADHRGWCRRRPPGAQGTRSPAPHSAPPARRSHGGRGPCGPGPGRVRAARPGGGRRAGEIRPPVEHPHVDEEGEGEQLALPAVRAQRLGKEVVHRGR